MTRAERTEELILIKHNLRETYYEAIQRLEPLKDAFTVAENKLRDYIAESKRLAGELEDTSQKS
jgi:CRISPR/Cas system CMR-associated protein Cmr5 small subunit